MCIKLSTGPQARVGQSTSLSMSTFVPYLGRKSPNQLRLSPSPVPQYPFRVRAYDTRGRSVEIAVRPIPGANTWSGTITFEHAGLWTIRVLNFESVTDPRCYEPIRIEVAPGDIAEGRDPLVGWAWIAAGFALVAAAVFVLRRGGPGQPSSS
jgi:hypothetical protein